MRLIQESYNFDDNESIAFKMFFLQIYFKESQSTCLGTKKKIIKKHYPKRKHEGQSTFFKFISPRRLFNEVTNFLRSGTKVNEIQGSAARSDVRYIYYYTFAFKVGTFRPNRRGGFPTKTVKIVCKHTKCAKCGRHWPSEVLTIFPYRKPFI